MQQKLGVERNGKEKKPHRWQNKREKKKKILSGFAAAWGKGKKVQVSRTLIEKAEQKQGECPAGGSTAPNKKRTRLRNGGDRHRKAGRRKKEQLPKPSTGKLKRAKKKRPIDCGRKGGVEGGGKKEQVRCLTGKKPKTTEEKKATEKQGKSGGSPQPANKGNDGGEKNRTSSYSRVEKKRMLGGRTNGQETKEEGETGKSRLNGVSLREKKGDNTKAEGTTKKKVGGEKENSKGENRGSKVRVETTRQSKWRGDKKNG